MYAAKGNDATKWQQPNHHGPISYTFSPAFHTAECGLWWGLLLVALVYVFRQRHTISNTKTWLIVFGLLVVILLNSLQTSAFVVYALQHRHSISFVYLLNVFCFHASRTTFVAALLAVSAHGDLGSYATVPSKLMVSGTMLAAGLFVDYKFLDVDIYSISAVPIMWFVRAGIVWFAYRHAMEFISEASTMKTVPQEEHLLHKAGQGSGPDTKAKRTSLRRALFGVAVCAVISIVIGMAVGVAIRKAVGEVFTIVNEGLNDNDPILFEALIKHRKDLNEVFGKDGKEVLRQLKDEVVETDSKLGSHFVESSVKYGMDYLEALIKLGIEDGARVGMEDLAPIFMSIGVLAGTWIGVLVGVMVGVAAFMGFLLILFCRGMCFTAAFGLFIFFSMGAPASAYQCFPILCQLSFFVGNFVFVVHVARTVQAIMTTPQPSGTTEAKVEREKCD